MSRELKKQLLIQGATGSIGKSTLSVIRNYSDDFEVVGLSANSNLDELLVLASEFQVKSLALKDEKQYDQFKQAAKALGITELYCGENAAAEQASNCDYDLLVNAVMGGAGLLPTFNALKRGISVALANKESLVAAGPLLQMEAQKNNANIIPIDSEHSAILQCLVGENPDWIEKIWLTSSGGPFIDKPIHEFKDITVAQALAHPTWKMGPKITIDSATLFNKGLEVIEAERLFKVMPDQIQVVIHRQSIVHSMVEFCDGSLKAQLSVPDMKLPILYALTYPKRVKSNAVSTKVSNLRSLTFEEVSIETFPCLSLAYESLKLGGTAPAALSAADEVAVSAFLQNKIGFNDIPDLLEKLLMNWPNQNLDSIQTVIAADQTAREMSEQILNKMISNTMSMAC